MKVHGSCHCDAIAFVAETDPRLTSVCHCHDCQKLTGTAFRVSTPALPGTFSLLRGTPKVYVKVAESGSRRAQAFCGDCGSQLFTYDADQGVAMFLMKQMCSIAFHEHKASEVTVSCFNFNTAGLLLYPKLGFQPFATEERQDKAGNRVALIHMRLSGLQPN